ncbi:unnamed protein product [Caenorhabditis auriculariae]|uniref:Uncharacterized protein n=1 Tax=Caenorhabditis auriculariae TaxID=2777116 RepID=A0A8S1H5L7_9PELO|nr:unnamed protein product [Caenorhabditis auriculariae]
MTDFAKKAGLVAGGVIAAPIALAAVGAKSAYDALTKEDVEASPVHDFKETTTTTTITREYHEKEGHASPELPTDPEESFKITTTTVSREYHDSRRGSELDDSQLSPAATEDSQSSKYAEKIVTKSDVDESEPDYKRTVTMTTEIHEFLRGDELPEEDLQARPSHFEKEDFDQRRLSAASEKALEDDGYIEKITTISTTNVDGEEPTTSVTTKVLEHHPEDVPDQEHRRPSATSEKSLPADYTDIITTTTTVHEHHHEDVKQPMIETAIQEKPSSEVESPTPEPVDVSESTTVTSYTFEQPEQYLQRTETAENDLEDLPTPSEQKEICSDEAEVEGRASPGRRLSTESGHHEHVLASPSEQKHLEEHDFPSEQKDLPSPSESKNLQEEVHQGEFGREAGKLSEDLAPEQKDLEEAELDLEVAPASRKLSESEKAEYDFPSEQKDLSSPSEHEDLTKEAPASRKLSEKSAEGAAHPDPYFTEKITTTETLRKYHDGEEEPELEEKKIHVDIDETTIREYRETANEDGIVERQTVEPVQIERTTTVTTETSYEGHEDVYPAVPEDQASVASLAGSVASEPRDYTETSKITEVMKEFFVDSSEATEDVEKAAPEKGEGAEDFEKAESGDEETLGDKMLGFAKKAGMVAGGVIAAPVALAAIGAKTAYDAIKKGDEDEEDFEQQDTLKSDEKLPSRRESEKSLLRHDSDPGLDRRDSHSQPPSQKADSEDEDFEPTPAHQYPSSEHWTTEVENFQKHQEVPEEHFQPESEEQELSPVGKSMPTDFTETITTTTIVREFHHEEKEPSSPASSRKSHSEYQEDFKSSPVGSEDHDFEPTPAHQYPSSDHWTTEVHDFHKHHEVPEEHFQPESGDQQTSAVISEKSIPTGFTETVTTTTTVREVHADFEEPSSPALSRRADSEDQDFEKTPAHQYPSSEHWTTEVEDFHRHQEVPEEHFQPESEHRKLSPGGSEKSIPTGFVETVTTTTTVREFHQEQDEPSSPASSRKADSEFHEEEPTRAQDHLASPISSEKADLEDHEFEPTPAHQYPTSEHWTTDVHDFHRRQEVPEDHFQPESEDQKLSPEASEKSLPTGFTETVTTTTTVREFHTDFEEPSSQASSRKADSEDHDFEPTPAHQCPTSEHWTTEVHDFQKHQEVPEEHFHTESESQKLSPVTSEKSIPTGFTETVTTTTTVREVHHEAQAAEAQDDELFTETSQRRPSEAEIQTKPEDFSEDIHVDVNREGRRRSLGVSEDPDEFDGSTHLTERRQSQIGRFEVETLPIEPKIEEEDESLGDKVLDFAKKAGMVAGGVIAAPVALAAVGAKAAYDKLKSGDDEEDSFVREVEPERYAVESEVFEKSEIDVVPESVPRETTPPIPTEKIVTSEKTEFELPTAEDEKVISVARETTPPPENVSKSSSAEDVPNFLVEGSEAEDLPSVRRSAEVQDFVEAAVKPPIVKEVSDLFDQQDRISAEEAAEAMAEQAIESHFKEHEKSEDLQKSVPLDQASVVSQVGSASSERRSHDEFERASPDLSSEKHVLLTDVALHSRDADEQNPIERVEDYLGLEHGSGALEISEDQASVASLAGSAAQQPAEIVEKEEFKVHSPAQEEHLKEEALHSQIYEQTPTEKVEEYLNLEPKSEDLDAIISEDQASVASLAGSVVQQPAERFDSRRSSAGKTADEMESFKIHSPAQEEHLRDEAFHARHDEEQNPIEKVEEYLGLEPKPEGLDAEVSEDQASVASLAGSFVQQPAGRFDSRPSSALTDAEKTEEIVEKVHSPVQEEHLKEEASHEQVEKVEEYSDHEIKPEDHASVVSLAGSAAQQQFETSRRSSEELVDKDDFKIHTPAQEEPQKSFSPIESEPYQSVAREGQLHREPSVTHLDEEEEKESLGDKILGFGKKVGMVAGGVLAAPVVLTAVGAKTAYDALTKENEEKPAESEVTTSPRFERSIGDEEDREDRRRSFEDQHEVPEKEKIHHEDLASPTASEKADSEDHDFEPTPAHHYPSSEHWTTEVEDFHRHQEVPEERYQADVQHGFDEPSQDDLSPVGSERDLPTSYTETVTTTTTVREFHQEEEEPSSPASSKKYGSEHQDEEEQTPAHQYPSSEHWTTEVHNFQRHQEIPGEHFRPESGDQQTSPVTSEKSLPTDFTKTVTTTTTVREFHTDVEEPSSPASSRKADSEDHDFEPTPAHQYPTSEHWTTDVHDFHRRQEVPEEHFQPESESQKLSPVTSEKSILTGFTETVTTTTTVREYHHDAEEPSSPALSRKADSEDHDFEPTPAHQYPSSDSWTTEVHDFHRRQEVPEEELGFEAREEQPKSPLGSDKSHHAQEERSSPALSKKSASEHQEDFELASPVLSEKAGSEPQEEEQTPAHQYPSSENWTTEVEDFHRQKEVSEEHFHPEVRSEKVPSPLSSEKSFPAEFTETVTTTTTVREFHHEPEEARDITTPGTSDEPRGKEPASPARSEKADSEDRDFEPTPAHQYPSSEHWTTGVHDFHRRQEIPEEHLAFEEPQKSPISSEKSIPTGFTETVTTTTTVREFHHEAEEPSSPALSRKADSEYQEDLKSSPVESDDHDFEPTPAHQYPSSENWTTEVHDFHRGQEVPEEQLAFEDHQKSPLGSEKFIPTGFTETVTTTTTVREFHQDAAPQDEEDSSFVPGYTQTISTTSEVHEFHRNAELVDEKFSPDHHQKDEGHAVESYPAHEAEEDVEPQEYAEIGGESEDKKSFGGKMLDIGKKVGLVAGGVIAAPIALGVIGAKSAYDALKKDDGEPSEYHYEEQTSEAKPSTFVEDQPPPYQYDEHAEDVSYEKPESPSSERSVEKSESERRPSEVGSISEKKEEIEDQLRSPSTSEKGIPADYTETVTTTTTIREFHPATQEPSSPVSSRKSDSEDHDFEPTPAHQYPSSEHWTTEVEDFHRRQEVPEEHFQPEFEGHQLPSPLSSEKSLPTGFTETVTTTTTVREFHHEPDEPTSPVSSKKADSEYHDEELTSAQENLASPIPSEKAGSEDLDFKPTPAHQYPSSQHWTTDVHDFHRRQEVPEEHFQPESEDQKLSPGASEKSLPTGFTETVTTTTTVREFHTDVEEPSSQASSRKADSEDHDFEPTPAHQCPTSEHWTTEVHDFQKHQEVPEEHFHTESESQKLSPVTSEKSIPTGFTETVTTTTTVREFHHETKEPSSPALSRKADSENQEDFKSSPVGYEDHDFEPTPAHQYPSSDHWTTEVHDFHRRQEVPEEQYQAEVDQKHSEKSTEPEVTTYSRFERSMEAEEGEDRRRSFEDQVPEKEKIHEEELASPIASETADSEDRDFEPTPSHHYPSSEHWTTEVEDFHRHREIPEEQFQPESEERKLASPSVSEKSLPTGFVETVTTTTTVREFHQDQDEPSSPASSRKADSEFHEEEPTRAQDHPSPIPSEKADFEDHDFEPTSAHQYPSSEHWTTDVHDFHRRQEVPEMNFQPKSEDQKLSPEASEKSLPTGFTETVTTTTTVREFHHEAEEPSSPALSRKADSEYQEDLKSSPIGSEDHDFEPTPAHQYPSSEHWTTEVHDFHRRQEIGEKQFQAIPSPLTSEKSLPTDSIETVTTTTTVREYHPSDDVPSSPAPSDRASQAEEDVEEKSFARDVQDGVHDHDAEEMAAHKPSSPSEKEFTQTVIITTPEHKPVVEERRPSLGSLSHIIESRSHEIPEPESPFASEKSLPRQYSDEEISEEAHQSHFVESSEYFSQPESAKLLEKDEPEDRSTSREGLLDREDSDEEAEGEKKEGFGDKFLGFAKKAGMVAGGVIVAPVALAAVGAKAAYDAVKNKGDDEEYGEYQKVEREDLHEEEPSEKDHLLRDSPVQHDIESEEFRSQKPSEDVTELKKREEKHLIESAEYESPAESEEHHFVESDRFKSSPKDQEDVTELETRKEKHLIESAEFESPAEPEEHHLVESEGFRSSPKDQEPSEDVAELQAQEEKHLIESAEYESPIDERRRVSEEEIHHRDQHFIESEDFRSSPKEQEPSDDVVELRTQEEKHLIESAEYESPADEQRRASEDHFQQKDDAYSSPISTRLSGDVDQQDTPRSYAESLDAMADAAATQVVAEVLDPRYIVESEKYEAPILEQRVSSPVRKDETDQYGFENVAFEVDTEQEKEARIEQDPHIVDSEEYIAPNQERELESPSLSEKQERFGFEAEQDQEREAVELQEPLDSEEYVIESEEYAAPTFEQRLASPTPSDQSEGDQSAFENPAKLPLDDVEKHRSQHGSAHSLVDEAAIENVTRMQYRDVEEESEDHAAPGHDDYDEWKVYGAQGEVLHDFSEQLSENVIQEAESNASHFIATSPRHPKKFLKQESCQDVTIEPEVDYQSDLQEKLDILANEGRHKMDSVKEEEYPEQLDVIHESDYEEQDEKTIIQDAATRLVDEVIEQVMETVALDELKPVTSESNIYFTATEQSKDDNYDTCVTSQEDTYESAHGWTSQDSEYTTATSGATSRLSDTDTDTARQDAATPLAVLSPVDSDRHFTVAQDYEIPVIRAFDLEDANTARSTPDVPLQVTIEEEESDDLLPTSPSGVLLAPSMDPGRPISPVPPGRVVTKGDEDEEDGIFVFVEKSDVSDEPAPDDPSIHEKAMDANTDESDSRYSRQQSDMSSESHADTVIQKNVEAEADTVTSVEDLQSMYEATTRSGSTDSLDNTSMKSSGSGKQSSASSVIVRDIQKEEMHLDVEPQKEAEVEYEDKENAPGKPEDKEESPKSVEASPELEGFEVYPPEGEEPSPEELATVEEEPEDSDSMNGGSGNSSVGMPSDTLGLVGQYKHVSSDNISLSSLQEFERLEQIVSARGEGSLTASEIELYAAGKLRSGEGSISSLAEFEKLEQEAVANQSPQDEVMMLSDIREESEAEDMSIRDDDEELEPSDAEMKTRPVNDEDVRGATPIAASPTDSLEREHLPSIQMLETSTDSLEPTFQEVSVAPDAPDSMDETSLAEYEDKDSLLEGASQGVESQDTFGLLSGDTVGTYHDEDKDSLDGDMANMLRSYPTTLTTFETTAVRPDGSVQTISRRVETRVRDPLLSHVTFTGTESEERLNQLPDEEQFETVDSEGNVTRTVFRRQSPTGQHH